MHIPLQRICERSLDGQYLMLTPLLCLPLEIVLNPSTYPNFLRFLRRESIPTVPTEMTFSVSRDSGAFEWAGKNLFTVFCQPQNLLNPSMWRLVWDVLRFNASVRKLLHSKTEDSHLSIGTYLEREGYSNSFRDNYLIASGLHMLCSLLSFS